MVHFIKSKVAVASPGRYQEILEYFMLPTADKLYGEADFLFQQDFAAVQSAKTKIRNTQPKNKGETKATIKIAS